MTYRVVFEFGNEVESDYAPTACPFCGEIENLDISIVGNWECPSCDREYFIANYRVVSPSEDVLYVLHSDGLWVS